MSNKRASYELADFKADTRPDHLGEATALVSVFGNVDLMGDRVVKGAFAKSLTAWGESGDPIPVYWSHDWGNPKSNIGEVTAAHETDAGLEVDMKFDIHDNENAAYVFKLLHTRRVKEFSFAYQIEGERKGKDGANELTDLRILEVGPTFKGANPETELLATKRSMIPTLVGIEAALEAEEKAGARFSTETKSEMTGIADGLDELATRVRALMGSADETPKNDEPADDEDVALDTKSEDDEPETVKSEVPENNDGNEPTPATPDPELLAMKLRIEEMWTT